MEPTTDEIRERVEEDERRQSGYEAMFGAEEVHPAGLGHDCYDCAARDRRLLLARLDEREAVAGTPDVAALREALTLRPHGYVGPERIPWFIHCGISHAEGADCRVCDLLAALPDAPVRREPPLDVAWQRLEAALPEGWGSGLHRWSRGGVRAFALAEGGGGSLSVDAPDLLTALTSLAARLANQPAELPPGYNTAAEGVAFLAAVTEASPDAAPATDETPP